MTPRRLTHQDYSVGWVCALKEELAAATAILDMKHPELQNPPSDLNAYTLGSIADHNIAIACLPEGDLGNNPAATVATRMTSTFPSVKFWLMVGVGGGVPPTVRLGDVVISTPVYEYPGVIQWDLGKAQPDNFERIGALNKPPEVLLAAVKKLRAQHERLGHDTRFLSILEEIRLQEPPCFVSRYLNRKTLEDLLFPADYNHEASPTNCRDCDRSKIVNREPRTCETEIHYGLIASGNAVVKDATRRDEISEKLNGNVLCFEMEAAGITNSHPCLVIRGICDYSDSHKNYQWQPYAALAAAAVAKELLEFVTPIQVINMPLATELLDEIRNVRKEAARKEAAKERKHILAWLSPLSFIAKHEELFTGCFKKTGEWLWQDQRFKNWAEGPPRYLQCVGEPGVGKTVLSCILRHHLATKSQRPPLILSMFLDYKASSAQTLPNLMGSLLKQMIQLDELYPIPAELKKLYQMTTRLELKPESYFDNVRKILVAELDRYDRIYLIVDGFDELASRERIALKRELLKLRSEKLSLAITMRPIEAIVRIGCDRCKGKDLKLYFRCKICNEGNYDICLDCKNRGHRCPDDTHQLTEVSLQPDDPIQVIVKIPDEDIKQYVRCEIGVKLGNNKALLRDERLTGPDRPDTTPFQDLCESDPDLPEQIVSTVAQKASGRFLFARSYMDSLKTKSNLRMLKKALETFPDNINDIHKDAMHRIQTREKDDRARPYKILGLVARARRPLSLKELQHALAVMDFGDEGGTETDILLAIDPANVILDVTSGLVIIENNGSEVRLIHRSLEDYLEESQSNWFPNADIEIAKACLTYLRLVVPHEPQQDKYFFSKNAKYPFLQYASQYWGDHIRDAQFNSKSDGGIQAAALRLINDSVRLNACMQAAWVTNAGGHDTWDTRRQVDRLHVCAWYGLSFAFSALDLEKSSVDVIELKYGQTPLMYACRKGHVEIVRQLLNIGASPQKVSARGRTAMFEAISGHHYGVVELLVNKQPPDLDINAIHTKEFNRTALMLATRAGRLDMVEKLLQFSGIGIDQQDVNGMTALYLAAKYGFEKLVDLLLTAGATIDIVDFKVGRSALRCAAERDHVKIIELLLQHNARPNLKDRHGGTAILHAVNEGAEEAVEKMMSCGVDIQCVDENEQSLLHGASKNGRHKIARLLLEERLDPNLRDKVGRTPLHLASQYGSLAVLSTLLKKGADPSLTDKFSRTPSIVAWQYGHTDIMCTLSKTEDGQLKNKGEPVLDDNQLPVWSMARQCLTDLITEVIKTRSLDLTATEPFSENNALHCAIEANELKILRLLLEAHILPVNALNYVQRSPLMVAALEGNLRAIRLLLSHGAKPDLKDRWDDEALVLAQSNGHLEVMIALIEAGASIDTQKIDTERLFFAAVEARKVSAVRVLLKKGVDRSVQNMDGVTASQIARAGHDEEMMRLLAAAPMVMVEGVWGRWRNGEEAGRRGFVPFGSRPLRNSLLQTQQPESIMASFYHILNSQPARQ